MALPNIITILTAKRSRLAGEIEALQKALAKARDDLGHVDGTLRLYGYEGPEYIPVTRVKRTRFAKRELRGLIEAIEATGITQNKFIALEICRRKGWDGEDRELVRKVADCVSAIKYGRKIT